jgi:hypothetical protein
MAAKIPAAGVDLDGAITINESSADADFRIESNGKANMFFVDGGNDRIGINTTGSVNHLVNIEDVTNNGGGTLGLTVSTSGTSDNLGRLHFGNATDSVVAAVFGIADGANDAGALTIRTEATGAALEEGFRVNSSRKLSTNGETAPDVDTGGLTINHGANDGLALSFKNSDVSHGMSGATEVDTYGQMQKAGAADGGFRIMGFCDGSADVMQIMGFGATAQTTDTTGSGAMVELFGAKKSGTSLADLASNENLVAFRQYGGTTRFIMKSDGTVHASDTSWATSLDTYDDAQLCRSMDMLPAESTREGFISDKWTQMVKYNIDDLVDAGIYTKDGKDMIEKGETPFFRVQPLLRLHNGAIWQNYTKHQKLAEAVYEMAKEALGKDKADAILEKHDIKLLN